MAYGDSRFDPKHGLPTVEVRVAGKDSKWRTIVRERKFIIDSGSNLSFIESSDLRGMEIQYLGSVIGQTASGTVAQNVFSGPILQFQGINAKGEKIEFSCEEPFVIQSPALLGGTAFKTTGVCVSLDYKRKTVRITGRKPRSRISVSSGGRSEPD
jgi:hypothetical protein